MTVAGVAGEEWDSHLLLLYREEAERQDSLALWIQRGLDLDEKILYTGLRTAGAILPGLTQRGVDLLPALDRGQFSFVPVDAFCPAEGQTALVRGALDEGYPGVRLSAEVEVFGLLSDEECRAVDQRLDELCRRFPVSALCQCDTGRITGNVLGAVIDTHPEALRVPELSLRRSGHVVFLAGEIDLSSAPPVSRWLHGVCRREVDLEVVLDLSGLSFIDVAGYRALLTGTSAFRGQGGVVRLRGVHGHALKVLTLLDVHSVSGMEVA